jgi:bilirubin oxidase
METTNFIITTLVFAFKKKHIKSVSSLFLITMLMTVVVLSGLARVSAAGALDPGSIPKYLSPLVIPPVMPPVVKGQDLTEYHITVRQFDQQILPAGMPMTKVWGYGAEDGPAPGVTGATFNYPGYTVEVRKNERVRVKWINGLVDADGGFLPHLLPLDPTLHWANPPGPSDMEPEFLDTPGRYMGPVPIVTHLHGAHVPAISDGFPEAWYLPDANDIPVGYYTRGSHYGTVLPAEPGTAWFEYPNDQRATTLWYHDHALGMTRLNVYAGLAGFWLIRDDMEDSLNLPGPAPRPGDPPATKYYEIPIVIQDRSFNDDGSLFYPEDRAFFDEFTGPFLPGTTVPPLWNPEFFGNTIVVNGNTWPFLDVEPRKYRLRFLNGSNSRFLVLKMVSDPLAVRPATQNLGFHQIGNDGGLIPNGPVALNQLVMAPAERMDVIVDFSTLSPGAGVYLINEGPDEPFGGLPVEIPSDPNTTGQVMKFNVVSLSEPDTSTLPSSGSLAPPVVPLGPSVKTRDLTLNEIVYSPADVPVEAHLGTGTDGPLSWGRALTEMPNLDDTETWRLINLTEDSHPIHLHLVMFEIMGRIPFDAEGYRDAQNAYLSGGKLGAPPDPETFATGAMELPNSWEAGTKDTVIANPEEITLVKAKFDLPGLYVWHCHILEHEDNEMMRPYMVVDRQCATFDSATNMLHVPCFDLGESYFLDLSLINDNPIQLAVANAGASTSAGSQCATFNPLTGVLHLPCVDLETRRYSADFVLKNTAPFSFELFNHEEIQ